MNAKIVLSIALALPLSAQAEAPITDIDPVHAVAAKSQIKYCYHSPLRPLGRDDVARGLGRAWSGEMNPLRDDANRQAVQVCREGWPAVKFTFLRGKGPQDMAIVTAATHDRLAAAP